MKSILTSLKAGLILQMEYLCLVGLLKFTDGSVRLVNPSSSASNPSAGRLEVWYNGEWGTVCDDGFTDAGARVVCASLGFGRTGYFSQNAFGAGSGRIWLDEVNCTGSETSINSCLHSTWGDHNCAHSEDTSITCDIDECSTGQSRCDATTTTCFNTYGSYQCTCRNGHRSWNSTSCTDIDECSTGQSRCDTTTTTCFNTIGSYQCTCRNGYRSWNSTSCTDINECTTRQSQCDYTSTTCDNTVGSYFCSCRNGYRRSSSSFCIDVNECEREELCDNSSTICINSAGSYHCSCRTGYKRENNAICSDIEECLSGETDCDPVSTDCINTIGSYTCSCKNGFTYLNETSCLVNVSSHGRLLAIVGSSAGVFLVASLVILFPVLYLRRRKKVHRPQQTQCSSVTANNGSDVKVSKIRMSTHP